MLLFKLAWAPDHPLKLHWLTSAHSCEPASLPPQLEIILCVLLGNHLKDFSTGKDVHNTRCPYCLSIGGIDRNISVRFKGIHPGRFSLSWRVGCMTFTLIFGILHLLVISMCLSSKRKRIQGCLIFMLRKWITAGAQRHSAGHRAPGLVVASVVFYPALILSCYSNVSFWLCVQVITQEGFVLFCLLSPFLYFSTKPASCWQRTNTIKMYLLFL